MSKAPAFMFYAGDYLASSRVQLMTLEEEGAYIRLLCHCWNAGSIPKEPEQIARLIGKGASTTLATNVATMFIPKGNVLVHDRLEKYRDERQRWIEKSREGGLKSAEMRKLLKKTQNNPSESIVKGGTKGGSRVVADCLQPNGNTSSSTSSLTITGSDVYLLGFSFISSYVFMKFCLCEAASAISSRYDPS